MKKLYYFDRYGYCIAEADVSDKEGYYSFWRNHENLQEVASLEHATGHVEELDDDFDVGIHNERIAANM